jgi:hypothetical protein
MDHPKKILVKKEITPEVAATEQDTVKKKVMVKVPRAELERIAKIKRDEIIRKKDSIINRNLNATGLTREQYRKKQVLDSKKPDCKVDGLQVGSANKRGETKGSCSTGESNKGESLKDTK